MSDGQKNTPVNIPDESQLINLKPEEFNSIVQRVHGLLVRRIERAHARKQAHPSERSASNYIEVSKDAVVFVHMMKLIEHMSYEIGDLRQMLTALGASKGTSDLPELFGPKKTNLPN